MTLTVFFCLILLGLSAGNRVAGDAAAANDAVGDAFLVVEKVMKEVPRTRN
jgi:hypothetical protein